MSCCNANTSNHLKFSCPICGNKGIVVDLTTPQHLLTDNQKELLLSDIIYKFCKNQSCNVAYFSEDKQHLFFTVDLKEKATLKDRGMDVKVCYCFGYTRQDVLSELQNTGKSSVLEDIKFKMKDPGCFCEKSNPQGACCLGNVTAWMKQAKELILRDEEN
jgi:hypothetical protein